jgi:hypothetical protein
MNYYASKRFLVQVERPEQEGEIHTIHGTLPVKPTDIVATDEFGVQYIMSERHFQDNYVPVEKVKRNFDLDAMAKAYAEALPNQEEDETYINGTKELINNNI